MRQGNACTPSSCLTSLRWSSSSMQTAPHPPHTPPPPPRSVEKCQRVPQDIPKQTVPRHPHNLHHQPEGQVSTANLITRRASTHQSPSYWFCTQGNYSNQHIRWLSCSQAASWYFSDTFAMADESTHDSCLRDDGQQWPDLSSCIIQPAMQSRANVINKEKECVLRLSPSATSPPSAFKKTGRDWTLRFFFFSFSCSIVRCWPRSDVWFRFDLNAGDFHLYTTVYLCID